MTNDSHLFKTEQSAGCLPLFTGKMFNQFHLTDEHSGYWIDEKEGRKALLGRIENVGQTMDYQNYRWLHRQIASNTNERTLITMIAPKNVFTEVNSTTLKVCETGITRPEMLYFCAVTNSFVVDWVIRQKITTTLNMFYIYQLPIPRLTEKDPQFKAIVERADALICTTPEFDDLKAECGSTNLGLHSNPQKIRAELDAIIAHLYGLTEHEFVHILKTFPIVKEDIKAAALAEFKKIQGEDSCK